MLFAERWHTSPFDVLNQDIDDFIMIANAMIMSNSTLNTNTKKSTVKSKEQRIKVNDKTATGGWY